MATAKLTSKGQITLPREVREQLGVDKGDRVEFVIRDGGEIVIEPATLPLSTLRGCLKKGRRKVVSIEEMQDAIERGASGR